MKLPLSSSEPSKLIDPQNRIIKYLRLSVTDRCNLKCQYCMPQNDFSPTERAEILTLEENLRLLQIMAELGIQRVRFTGGEPLVRKNILWLMRETKNIPGITEIALTTNGILLETFLEQLEKIKIDTINVSLDTLDPQIFEKIAGRSSKEFFLPTIRAIQALAKFDQVEKKMNIVALKEVNGNQLDELVQFAWENNFTPRIIELMPIGEGVRLYKKHHLNQSEVFASLSRLVQPEIQPKNNLLRGPAYYLLSRTSPEKKIGFIEAVSENFCSGCNRIRVTAKGDIRPCLASPHGLSIKQLMRDGATDNVIKTKIIAVLGLKKDGHTFSVTLREQPRFSHHSLYGEHNDVEMIRTGG